MRAWLAGAARQIPGLTARGSRHLLSTRSGRIALGLVRVGLVLLMLDSDLRLTVADVAGGVR